MRVSESVCVVWGVIYNSAMTTGRVSTGTDRDRTHNIVLFTIIS